MVQMQKGDTNEMYMYDIQVFIYIIEFFYVKSMRKGEFLHMYVFQLVLLFI